MGDLCFSIVPRVSNYPSNKEKAKEILEWLISLDIVKPNPSNCGLGSYDTYAISEGAKQISDDPRNLSFGDITGVEIVTERQVFHAWRFGLEEVVCPNCHQDFVSDDWGVLTDWNDNKSDNLSCPLCHFEADINNFKFSPVWGFSNLGFSFWNWTEFTEAFINDFKQRLGCDILIVYAKV